MWHLLFIALFFACFENAHAFPDKNAKIVRGCTGWGFYAEFLWVLNHLHCAVRTNKTPVVYWDSSFAYYLNTGYNGSTNCWEYYFEPVSSLSYKAGDHLYKLLFYPEDNPFTVLWNYDQYIDNLALLKNEQGNKVLKVTSGKFPRGTQYPVGNQHLYNETFRKYVKEKLIDRFIRPKKQILDQVEFFYQRSMAGKKTIGIHLRGDFVWSEVPFVPTRFLLSEANSYADGNTQYFIATDQQPLLEEAKKGLKGKVIFFDAQRFNHSTAPIAGGSKLHPILGENVIIEMLLLSRCDYLIHTVSNVSTTVLYFNPTLKHTMLY